MSQTPEDSEVALESAGTESQGHRGAARKGFGHLKSAWSASLIIKIIAIVVAFLIVLFFILMVAFASSKSSCSTELDNSKKDSDTKAKEIKTLKADLEDAKEKIADEEKKNTQLREENTKLQKQITELNGKIQEKDTEITRLTNEVKKKDTEIGNLNTRITELQAQITQKDAEIERLKKEVSSRDATIAKLNQEITYYRYGLIGSGVVHVIVAIHDISTVISLSNANAKVATLQQQVSDLNGTNTNLRNEILKLKNEINKLEQELKEAEELRRKCQTELSHCKMDLDTCNKKVEVIQRQMEIIPHLALDQAVLKLLLQRSRYAYHTSLMYNASHEGFHKETFIRAIGNMRPTVIIVRTETGYVFGGSINITWGGEGGKHVDHDAFTFSANHHHICDVSVTGYAVNFVSTNLVEFGVGEFIVENSGSHTTGGEGTSDRDYSCHWKDPNQFYNDGHSMRVVDVLAYAVTFTPPPADEEPSY